MHRNSPARPKQPSTDTVASSHNRLPHTALLACLLVIASLPDSSQAGLYKWVDEQGNVHYGDRPPADPDTGHQRYNEQGVVVDSKPAALTEAEREAARAAERRRRQQAEREAARQLRDRVLLETFTTERDLLLARDDRIGALDATIALSAKHLNNWNDKLARVEGQIADLAEQSEDAPQLLLDERASLRRKIAGAEKFSAQKIAERSALAEQFEADISRYRELRREQAEMMEQLGNN